MCQPTALPLTYRSSPQSEPSNCREDVKSAPAPSTTACGDIRCLSEAVAAARGTGLQHCLGSSAWQTLGMTTVLEAQSIYVVRLLYAPMLGQIRRSILTCPCMDW